MIIVGYGYPLPYFYSKSLIYGKRPKNARGCVLCESGILSGGRAGVRFPARFYGLSVDAGRVRRF